MSFFAVILIAPELTADFVNGEVSVAEASSPVELIERHSFSPTRLLRRVCADTARVQFDSLGEMEMLRLNGNVDYQASDMQASGDRIVALQSNGSVSITGKPAAGWHASGACRPPASTSSNTNINPFIARKTGRYVC